MPRGLLLLILLLLAGGYFFFFHGSGGSSPYALPSISGTAKIVRGSNAYTLVYSGKIHLPQSVEYNIAKLTASLLVDGVPLKTQPLPTSVVKGPSDYPISFSPNIPLNAHAVSLRIDANIVAGGKDYGLSVDIPVALPDKSLLVKDPSFDVFLSSVRLTGSSKAVTLVVGVYNPNDSDISLSDLKLTLGNATEDVPIQTVPKDSHASASVDFTIPANVTTAHVVLSGKYTASGQTYSFSRSFDMNIPDVPVSEPRVSISAMYAGISANGYSVKFAGSIANPNDFPIVLDSLRVVVSSGDVSQDVNLLSNKTILPDSNAEFSKTSTVLFVFSRATAKLVAHYNGADHVLATFPIGVANPASFISAPSVELNVGRDTNSGLCVFDPKITNNNSFSIDLNGVVLSAADVTKHYDNTSVANGKTLDLGTVDVNASGAVVATISGEYGIKNLGVWIPFTFATELNCP
ncbi:MAG: hypothetical protein GXN93_00195 [Candidatus Diapherotrites archaeon]|nr:hypothetical protein [Candidatus Diapherotrites archaeon]